MMGHLPLLTIAAAACAHTASILDERQPELSLSSANRLRDHERVDGLLQGMNEKPVIHVGWC